MKRPSPAFAAIAGLAWCLASDVARSDAADGPRVWGIVVGINKYEDTRIPRCDASIRDARSAAEWLAAQWGESALLRMDDLGKPTHGAAAEKQVDLLPTRENLDWAVKDWLGVRVHPDDVVVFYFAGQAAARAPAAGSGAGRVYLLPIDARAADLGLTGWSLEDALDRSGAARKAKVVIWLDTSPRGRGGRGLNPEEGSPSGLDWLRSLTRWEGVTAWLASETRRPPEDGAFIAAIRASLGQPGRAHNLLGTLNAMNGDPSLAARGFRAMGGVGPDVSLWPGRVIEQAVPELIVQSGHGDRVTSVIVAPDNGRVVTASMDSTVRIWKLGEREPSMVRVLTDPFVGVKSLALDRDGRILLAGDGAGGIVGWDMTQDRPKSIYGPPEHEEAVDSLTFLPDSLKFVSLDRGGHSVLWDASGGVIKKTRDFSDESIVRLASAGRTGAGAPAMVAAVRSGTGGPDALRTYDARGAALARLDGPGGRITSLDLSEDGRTLVVGDDRGRLLVLGLPGRTVLLDRKLSGAVHLARLSRSGPIAVADDRSLRLIEPKAGGLDVELADPKGLAAPGRVGRAEFSPDGRWLAACTAIEGRLLVWRLDDPARPTPLVFSDREAPGLSPGFSPDGRLLVVGDQDGGIRAWTLDDGPAGPRAEVLARIRPARGKVAGLAPSPSGKLLLEITRDDLALVWDLDQGRGCKPLPGAWSSGSFLPDESRLILSRVGSEGGDLVLFDRSENGPLPLKFARPVDVDGKPLNATFGRVAVSRSGKWVAACASESQLPLACVWEVATGRLAHTARVHDGGVTALDFSSDEAFLLTASEDGRAKLWPLTDTGVDLRASTIFSGDDGDDPAFTAARVSPADPHRVATGTRGGLVQLWRWEKGRGKPDRLGEPFKLDGSINALAFSSDGRWLAASSSLGKSIRFWDVSGEGKPRAVEFKPRIHHAEQIRALAGWPGGPTIVSGGDDAALRFWNLNERALSGSLVAQARDTRTVDWLAYTPEGLFDGSMPGESMVKWRVAERVVTLQQTEDTHYAFRVAASIARGEKPRDELRLKAEGPSLKIFSPPAGPGIGREVELRLWSDSPRPPNLRLYQNGVPICAEGDFARGETEHFVTARVRLRTGENRLYAMASRPGSADGKSDEVVIRYDGPEPSGRLHTLALGISEYRWRALRYAHIDARGIADFLGRQGVRGADRPGEQIVLLDDKVTPAGVDDAFRRIRDAVKGHPEDTVVLFLAGHTDTDDHANQFCLLLPNYPFKPEARTLSDTAMRGIAVRGNAGDGTTRARVGDPEVLPYSLLYNRLTRLEALQRLVIIDACQAGAILEDQAVSRIQQNVEWGSRKARNSYLLAARRGEPANEVDALQHGLLTYTLLRGMGARDLRPIPETLGGFPGASSADLNRDGVVSSDELATYTDDTLPRLARLFPQVVLRAPGPVVAPRPGPNSPELEKKLRIQAGGASFPLVVFPR